MFEYELHQMRSAELIREADEYRLAREARRARRAARKASGEHAPGGQVNTRRHGRLRFARAA